MVGPEISGKKASRAKEKPAWGNMMLFGWFRGGTVRNSKECQPKDHSDLPAGPQRLLTLSIPSTAPPLSNNLTVCIIGAAMSRISASSAVGSGSASVGLKASVHLGTKVTLGGPRERDGSVETSVTEYSALST